MGSTVTVTVTHNGNGVATTTVTETVTATVTKTVATAATAAADYYASHAHQAIEGSLKKPHSLLRTILIIIASTMVAAAVGILGMAGWHVFRYLSEFFQDKYESQDRFSISSEGVGIRVKQRTEEDKNIAAQRLANKIWSGVPAK